MTAPGWVDIEGLCGDETCRTRVQFRLWLPSDVGVLPPCDRCAAAATEALKAGQRDRLRALGGGPGR